MKIESINSVAAYGQLYNLVSSCKFAAYEMYKFLMETKWKYIKRWSIFERNPACRKILLMIIDKVIETSIFDSCNKETLNNQPT